MTQLRSHLDAFDEAPAVHAIEGEVLLTGPHVDAAYTVPAARALAHSILAAVEKLERAGGV